MATPTRQPPDHDRSQEDREQACRIACSQVDDAKQEHVAAAGWCTYAGIVTTTADDDLDFAKIKALLKRVEQDIDGAKNRVRYTMNGFVIAVGSAVTPLAKQAHATAKKIGKVPVDMGGTACKVPVASDYITKIENAGRAAKSVRRFAARVQAFCSKSHIAAGSSGNENSNPSSARRRDAQ